MPVCARLLLKTVIKTEVLVIISCEKYIFKKNLKKLLTNVKRGGIIYTVPQECGNRKCWCGSMAEQLICNQQVVGSTPITSSNTGDFPSGQRGQTVNLLSLTSVVRIHHPPPKRPCLKTGSFLHSFILC